MSEVAEALLPDDRWRVPTHLDTRAGVGAFSDRQVLLGIAAGMLLAPAAAVLGSDLPGTLSLAGLDVPAGSLAGAAAVLGGALPFALPLEPPAEHGLGAFLRHRFRPAVLDATDVAERYGVRTVRGDVASVGPDHHVALWELPAVNTRLAPARAIAVYRAQWARLLDGLRVPVQVLVVSEPLPGTDLVERRRLLAVAAESPSLLRERAQLLDTALQRAALRYRRRLEGEDLRRTLDTLGLGVPLPEAGPPRLLDGLGKPRPGPPVLRRTAHALLAPEQGIAQAVLALSRWPRVVHDDWLAPLVDGPEPVTVCWNVEPLETEDVQRELELTLRKHETGGWTRRRGLAAKDVTRTLDQLEQNEQRAFRVGLLLVCRAADEAGVRARTRRVLQTVRELGADAQELRWEHDRGLQAADGTVRAGRVLPRRTRRVDTGSLARAYPLGASECILAGGVSWGETLEGRRPVVYTPWRRPTLPNPHVEIIGMSGSGKGFAWRVFTARALAARPAVFGLVVVVDQSEEYRRGEFARWARHCGGTTWAPSDRIPLEEALAFLGRRPAMSFAIGDLPATERGPFLVRLAEACREVAIARQRAGLPGVNLTVDELWSFLDDKGSARTIEHLIRRGRHWGLSFTSMTQRGTHTLDHPVAKVISSQAGTHWYGMQAPGEISDIGRRLRWTEVEEEAIERFGPGDGLLVAGPHRVGMHVDWTEAEYRMAATDGDDTEDEEPPTVAPPRLWRAVVPGRNALEEIEMPRPPLVPLVPIGAA